MVDVTRLGHPIARVIGVAAPSLFLLVWSFDAHLLFAQDVFIVALVQLVFIGAFIGYLEHQSA